MYSKSDSTFVEINKSLNKIYQYLNKPKTEQLGNDLFRKLIIKNISQNMLIFSIINSLEEKIMELPVSEIKSYANLLSYFFENNSYNISLKIYLSYLNPILSIIQSLIIEKNFDFLSKIPDIFMKIVQNLIPDDINASNKKLDDDEKKIYEILQNFCIYNLKFDKKLNQIIGSLCLTKLVENCPYVLKNNYMKLIVDTIISELSSEYFNAKYELLNCLISLILGAENLFCPYAEIVFNTIIDFLTNDDWMKRKLSLNIIYTLIFYCKEEMIPLQEHILNILNILKKDKIKEIKDISILITKIFNNNKNIINNKKKNNSINNKKKIYNKKRNKNLSCGNITSKIGKINYIKYNNISTLSPNRNIKNNNINLNTININPTKNYKLKNTPKNLSQNKKRKSSFNFNSSDLTLKNKNQKSINRTKNYSFINQKMVIKPDPSKSIFNMKKNFAFFKQNNNSDSKNKNLIIISNRNDNDNNIKKNFHNTFEGFYKNENFRKDNIINNEEEEKKIDNKLSINSMKNIEENMKKIDNDYDKNKEKINKLISLDAQIKTESINKIESNYISLSNKTKIFNQNNEISQSNQKEKKINNNENLIRVLLTEVRELSEKQISLLDLMDDIQTTTQIKIEELNNRIITLEDTIKELNEQLYILQNEE